MTDILITVPHETERYIGWSAHPVTLGIDSGDDRISGDGRALGYVSGGSIDPPNTSRPLTRVWVRLDADELAKLPEVREAVERTQG